MLAGLNPSNELDTESLPVLSHAKTIDRKAAAVASTKDDILGDEVMAVWHDEDKDEVILQPRRRCYPHHLLILYRPRSMILMPQELGNQPYYILFRN